MLAVAAGHELAGRTSVSLEVVGDCQHVDVETRPDYWFDSYVPSQTRRGRAIERRPLVRNTAEILTWTGQTPRTTSSALAQTVRDLGPTPPAPDGVLRTAGCAR